MNGRPFLKMHGLGNDFVVFDARGEPLALTPERIQALSDRHTGIGCDQLIVMEPARAPEADVFMRIYNSDGSEVSACGNATRCVGRLLFEDMGQPQVVVQTKAGLLIARRAEGEQVCVDMGPARLDWQDIPLSQAVSDTAHLPLSVGALNGPVGVSMGNPHAVFFVPEVEAVPLAELGPLVEHHPLFPERTNVEVVQVLSPSRLRMRVWERGTGITRACGTGACATAVAAVRCGLGERRTEVVLDGGSLFVEWREDGHVLMTGPAAVSFEGRTPL